MCISNYILFVEQSILKYAKHLDLHLFFTLVGLATEMLRVPPGNVTIHT